MGLLDEAIREHLELKRRRGADAGEVSREESEALGPVRRAPDGTPEAPAIAASAHETEYEEPVAAHEPEALTGPGWEDETAIHTPQDEPTAYEPPAPPRQSAYEPPPPAPPRPAYEPPAPPPPRPAYEPPASTRPSAYEPPAPPPPRPAYEPPAPPRPSSFELPAPPPVRRDPPPAFEPLLPPSVASPSTPPPPPPAPAAGHEPPPLLDPDPSPPAATPPPPREKSRFGAAARPLRLRRRGKGDDAPAEGPLPGRFGAHDRHTPAHEPVQEPFYDAPSRPGSASPPPPPPPSYQPPPPAAREPAGEDLLEETPEFLEETPDHDRLWFEQRPPRDFDFDG